MGHSETVNVIGLSEPEPIEGWQMRQSICYAMNKLEMAQERKKMAERGTPVRGWFAQTLIGCRMLGDRVEIWQEVFDSKVKHVKAVECEPCKGHGCFVCNYSGITRKEYWKKWHEWQLDETRAKYA